MTTEISVIYDNTTYLDTIVRSVTWSGDITQAPRKLDVALSNTFDGKKRAIPLEKGKELRFLNEGVELFRGVIFTDSIDDKGQMNVTAYDENIYLTKNADTKRYVKKTAAAIIKELCVEFGISVGSVVDTGYVIPKLILRDMTLWDMMITVLTETRKQTGRRFFIYASAGKLNLVERKEKVIEWVLENGTNITGASYWQSIEDLRNKVKVIGGDGEKNPLIATVKNDALVAKYGLMQHLERAEGVKSKSQIEQLSKQLLAVKGVIADKALVSALGIDSVIAGSAVYVRESMTGIIGGYYVSIDTHLYENGLHTMDLELSATDDLPQLEMEAEV